MPHPPETSEEATLRYWLANEDWYSSDYTRQWLVRTPTADAADLLARLAEEAGLEPQTFAVRLQAFIGLFSISGMPPEGAARRKAGIRAALLLAQGDPRCFAPLARVYETHPDRQSKYQEQIHRALLRFLQETREAPPNERPAPEEVAALVARLWERGEGRHNELNAAAAELIETALGWLQAQSPDLPDLAALRQRIAAEGAPTPRRRRIAETLEGAVRQGDRMGR